MADIHFFTDIDLLLKKVISTLSNDKSFVRTMNAYACFLFFTVNLSTYCTSAQIPQSIEKMELTELPYSTIKSKLNPSILDLEDLDNMLFLQRIKEKELIVVNDLHESQWGQPDEESYYTDEIRINAKLMETEVFMLFHIFSVERFSNFSSYYGYLICVDKTGKVMSGLISDFHSGNSNGKLDRETVVNKNGTIEISEVVWGKNVELGDQYELNVTYSVNNNGHFILTKKCISF